MTNESLEELAKMLCPPSHPKNSQGDWSSVEVQLGVKLPPDYKSFIATYGSGQIGGTFEVFNFLEDTNSAKKDAVYLKDVNDRVYGEMLNVASIMKRDSKSAAPPISFPIYPDAGGMFPWGAGQDGWECWWLMNGDFHDWDIIATFKWVEQVHKFAKTSMTDFLVNILQKPYDPGFRLAQFFEPHN